jgi:sugar/nucleoside kinase (ribokinase family)
MLAIRSTVTLGNDVETLIFDEVDTGIGGVTASALGERLARLAAATQIVCITHLPQLVAFADRHFAITKVTDAEARTTQTVVQEIEGEARIAELCRMLGASPDGEVACFPALPVRGEIDIVGAGDSVTANLATALAAGASLPEALEMANAAASVVIHQLGTTGTATIGQIAELLGA